MGRYLQIDPTQDQPAADPADVVCLGDTFSRLLKSLPSDQVRSIVASLVVQDLSYATIAERLGTTQAAVKMAIQRVREKQRQDGGAN